MSEKFVGDLLSKEERISHSPCEAIVVLGRGVCKDKEGRWRPTPYFEQLKESQHSGVFNNNPDPENENTVIGGGNANVLAIFHLYKELSKCGRPPKLIIFAAGRPDFLKSEPSAISEGMVMRNVLFRRLDREKIKRPETIILADNKNTKDDIEESLKTLVQRGIKTATIITVQVHVDRAIEFTKLAKAKTERSADIDITFISSEAILGEINPRYKKIFEEAKKSAPSQRTEIKEKVGIEALRRGKYNFESQGYTFSTEKN